MKKLTLSLISLIVCLCFMLSGCSKPAILSFSQAYLGDNTNTIKEQLTYQVKYQQNFGTEFTKDTSITSDIIDFDYQGTYTLSWEATSSLPEKSSLFEKTISGNVASLEKNTFYLLKSNLQITATYNKINNQVPEVTTYEDYILTETYFVSRNNSFAPIHSETDAKYSFIATSGSVATIGQTNYSFYVTYNKDFYTTYTKLKDDQDFTKQTHKYNYRTIIDNNQLIFLLRNLTIETDDTAELLAVSMQYGQPTELTIKNRGGSQIRYAQGETLTINGTAFDSQDQNTTEERVPVNQLGFLVNSIQGAGKEQIVFIQSGKAGNLPNTALPIQYIQPLVAQTSYKSLGVMSYKLVDIVTITQN